MPPLQSPPASKAEEGPSPPRPATSSFPGSSKEDCERYVDNAVERDPTVKFMMEKLGEVKKFFAFSSSLSDRILFPSTSRDLTTSPSSFLPEPSRSPAPGRLLRLPLLRPRRALLRGRRRRLQAPRRRRPLPQPPPAGQGRQGGFSARAGARLRPLPRRRGGERERRRRRPRLVRLRPPRVLRGPRRRPLGGLLLLERGLEGQLGPARAGAGLRAQEGGAVRRDESSLQGRGRSWSWRGRSRGSVWGRPGRRQEGAGGRGPGV